ncbi:MAG: RES family NAD+ phosphorylase, partial [Ignavibacteriales bacterium]|nr:RES family NAD+ phosphorylase [Ignavibacteriales bacterium]
DTGHSTNGRANPIGIPYLYVASDAKTAIAELRPNKGEKLTVAKFIVMEDMKFADLCDPKVSISPFQLNDDNELEQIYKNRPFLVRLSEELSKPIIPDDSKLEYLPTQYLCELVKQFGYNGIIYKSSVSKGKNLVIFNDEKLQCIECDEYRITDTEVMSEKIK